MGARNGFGRIEHSALTGMKPPTLDRLLWEAFSGNQDVEELLTEHADRVAFAFCGHTHRARENTLGAIRGYNVGGGYHVKRVLLLDWPTGHVEGHTFGEPEGHAAETG